ncbi:unnamed protein product [Ixodes pacificus]
MVTAHLREKKDQPENGFERFHLAPLHILTTARREQRTPYAATLELVLRTPQNRGVGHNAQSSARRFLFFFLPPSVHAHSLDTAARVQSHNERTTDKPKLVPTCKAFPPLNATETSSYSTTVE